MTKEELAKKKGLKVNKDSKQTAAENLLTIKSDAAVSEILKQDLSEQDNALNNSGDIEANENISLTENDNSSDNDESFAPLEAVIEEKKSKAGRPKGKPSTKISINVPTECLELAQIASAINFKGNMSSYISSLIKRDLEANKAIYEGVLEMRQK